MKLRYKIAGGITVALLAAASWLAWYVSHDNDCMPPPGLEQGDVPMMAITYGCYGGPEVLTLAEVPRPTPADNEILVRVEAAAVNPLDWHYMRGTPYIVRLMGAGIGTPSDTRLGVDYAGVVEAVGGRVTRFQVGDRVFGSGRGAFAEYLAADAAGGVVALPGGLSFDEGAATPVAGITALQALRDAGHLQPGQKVLVNGASGGVGTFAVQIAKAMGAEVHGVCSARNVERVYALGADRVFDYRKESYVESGERYDLVIDMISNHSLLVNRKVMADGGTLVIVGGKGGGDWLGPLIRPLGAVALSPFVKQDFKPFLARMKQDDLEILSGLMASGQVNPVIDRSFPLSETADAIRYSEAGHARGKIIIGMD